MSAALAIFRKELRVYLTTPPAYVFWALTLALCASWFWFASIHRVGDASLRYVLDMMVALLLFLGPVVTMRLIAEERARGTIELLLTSPVREWQVVVGKFFAAWCVFGAFLGVSLVFPAILFMAGQPGPDPGTLASQYLGLLLVTGALAALGVLCSAVAGSQIVAAIMGFLVAVSFVLLRVVAALTPGEAGQWLADLTFGEHLAQFARGIVDTTDMYYFVAGTIFLLFLATRALEARRWARV